MRKVKILNAMSYEDLEKAINKFYADNNEQIFALTDIKYYEYYDIVTDSGYCTYVITYKEPDNEK